MFVFEKRYTVWVQCPYIILVPIILEVTADGIKKNMINMKSLEIILFLYIIYRSWIKIHWLCGGSSHVCWTWDKGNGNNFCVESWNLLDSRRQRAVREEDILPLFIKAKEKSWQWHTVRGWNLPVFFILYVRSDIRTRYVGKRTKSCWEAV